MKESRGDEQEGLRKRPGYLKSGHMVGLCLSVKGTKKAERAVSIS